MSLDDAVHRPRGDLGDRAAVPVQRLVAVYDEQTGRNQWGTRDHDECHGCGSDMPVSSMGYGQCRRCHRHQRPAFE